MKCVRQEIGGKPYTCASMHYNINIRIHKHTVFHSSVAERVAVNHKVVGSKPSGSAFFFIFSIDIFHILIELLADDRNNTNNATSKLEHFLILKQIYMNT